MLPVFFCENCGVKTDGPGRCMNCGGDNTIIPYKPVNKDQNEEQPDLQDPVKAREEIIRRAQNRKKKKGLFGLFKKRDDFVCYYGCPNSKRVKKLNLHKEG